MYVIQEKREIQCKKCGYGWKTKSEMVYVMCPSCRHNNKQGVYKIEK